MWFDDQFCAEEVAIEKKLKRLVGKLGVPVTLFDTAPLGEFFLSHPNIFV